MKLGGASERARTRVLMISALVAYAAACATSTQRLLWHDSAFVPADAIAPVPGPPVPLPDPPPARSAVEPGQTREPPRDEPTSDQGPLDGPSFACDQPVPGFLAGLDLRPYRSIVFVVDATGNLCETVTGKGPVHFPLDRLGPALAAAVQGLSPETRFSIVWGAGGNVRQYVPTTRDGRALAQHLASNMFCDIGWSMSWALRRAFDERPEVVVLVSELYTERDFQRGCCGNPSYPRAPTAPTDDDVLTAVARWPDRVPVMVLSVRRRHPERLQQLAALTGGAYAVCPF